MFHLFASQFVLSVIKILSSSYYNVLLINNMLNFGFQTKDLLLFITLSLRICLVALCVGVRYSSVPSTWGEQWTTYFIRRPENVVPLRAKYAWSQDIALHTLLKLLSESISSSIRVASSGDGVGVWGYELIAEEGVPSGWLLLLTDCQIKQNEDTTYYLFGTLELYKIWCFHGADGLGSGILGYDTVQFGKHLLVFQRKLLSSSSLSLTSWN